MQDWNWSLTQVCTCPLNLNLDNGLLYSRERHLKVPYFSKVLYSLFGHIELVLVGSGVNSTMAYRKSKIRIFSDILNVFFIYFFTIFSRLGWGYKPSSAYLVKVKSNLQPTWLRLQAIFSWLGWGDKQSSADLVEVTSNLQPTSLR